MFKITNCKNGFIMSLGYKSKKGNILYDAILDGRNLISIWINEDVLNNKNFNPDDFKNFYYLKFNAGEFKIYGEMNVRKNSNDLYKEYVNDSIEEASNESYNE